MAKISFGNANLNLIETYDLDNTHAYPYVHIAGIRTDGYESSMLADSNSAFAPLRNFVYDCMSSSRGEVNLGALGIKIGGVDMATYDGKASKTVNFVADSGMSIKKNGNDMVFSVDSTTLDSALNIGGTRYKRINLGSGLSLSENGTTATLSTTGGGGTGGSSITYNGTAVGKISAGTGVGMSMTGDNLVISATGGGSGMNYDGSPISSIRGGNNINMSLNGGTLTINGKPLIAGDNISITNEGNGTKISASIPAQEGGTSTSYSGGNGIRVSGNRIDNTGIISVEMSETEQNDADHYKLFKFSYTKDTDATAVEYVYGRRTSYESAISGGTKVGTLKCGNESFDITVPEVSGSVDLSSEIAWEQGNGTSDTIGTLRVGDNRYNIRNNAVSSVSYDSLTDGGRKIGTLRNGTVDTDITVPVSYNSSTKGYPIGNLNVAGYNCSIYGKNVSIYSSTLNVGVYSDDSDKLVFDIELPDNYSGGGSSTTNASTSLKAGNGIYIVNGTAYAAVAELAAGNGIRLGTATTNSYCSQSKKYIISYDRPMVDMSNVIEAMKNVNSSIGSSELRSRIGEIEDFREKYIVPLVHSSKEFVYKKVTGTSSNSSIGIYDVDPIPAYNVGTGETFGWTWKEFSITGSGNIQTTTYILACKRDSTETNNYTLWLKQKTEDFA